MKKSMVLLTTLFFIFTISLLIIKNMEQTNSLIDESTKEYSYTQAFILINNITNQIVNNKKIKDIKSLYLNNDKYIPVNLNLGIKDIDVDLNIKQVSNKTLNINKLLTLSKNNNSEEYYDYKQKLQSLLLDSDINNIDTFEKSFLLYDKFSTIQQIEKVLYDFKKNKEVNILKIKDKLFYKDLDDNYLYCNIKVKHLKNKVYAKLLLNIKEKKVEILEITLS